MENDSRSGRGSFDSVSIPMQGWKIRFDTPPEEDVSRQAESGDILALFKAWDIMRHEASDRRQSPRYIPAETKVWLGWWKGTRFEVVHAELLNLSKGGAMIMVDNRPPVGQPVWICLAPPHPLDHVQARVLDTKHKPEGDFTARLVFHGPCPQSFFLAVGERVEKPLHD